MFLEIEIRKLAKSFYYQSLYASAKDVANITLFENTKNISGIQMIFLYWLRIYSMLFKELAEKEWINLDEEVINDNLRCDAFLYWRSKKIEKDLYVHKEEIRKMERKNKRSKGKSEVMPIWNG